MPERSHDELYAIADALIADAQDGEQVEVYVGSRVDTDVDVVNATLHSLTVATSEGVGIRVINDHRQGYASVGSLDIDLARDALAQARSNARWAAPDEFIGLVDLATADALPAAELDVYDPAVLSVPTADKVEMAFKLEQDTLARDQRIRGIETAAYGDVVGSSVIVSTEGIRVASRRSAASASVVAMAGEGVETRTGYGFTVGRSPLALDLSEAADDAAERTLRLLGAKQGPSATLPIVFDPLVSASLIGLIAAACNGEALIKGRSMFVNRLGEAVAAGGVTLIEDPTDARFFSAGARDGEGVVTRRTELISEGVFAAALNNAYTGRRSGAGTTGSAARGGYGSAPGVGARALRVVPGNRSQEEIIAGIDQGLYVQSLNGLHSGASTVSGDFSVGADGLMIRDGRLAEPVREMTIASTLQKMLLGISEIGADEIWLPGSAVGVTLLIDSMSVSGS